MAAHVAKLDNQQFFHLVVDSRYRQRRGLILEECPVACALQMQFYVCKKGWLRVSRSSLRETGPLAYPPEFRTGLGSSSRRG